MTPFGSSPAARQLWAAYLRACTEGRILDARSIRQEMFAGKVPA